jgi:hypothetical protein
MVYAFSTLSDCAAATLRFSKLHCLLYHLDSKWRLHLCGNPSSSAVGGLEDPSVRRSALPNQARSLPVVRSLLISRVRPNILFLRALRRFYQVFRRRSVSFSK